MNDVIRSAVPLRLLDLAVPKSAVPKSALPKLALPLASDGVLIERSAD